MEELTMTDTPIAARARIRSSSIVTSATCRFAAGLGRCRAVMLVTPLIVVIAAYWPKIRSFSQWAATAGIILLGITMALMVILLHRDRRPGRPECTWHCRRPPPTPAGSASSSCHYSALSRQYMDKACAAPDRRQDLARSGWLISPPQEAKGP